MNRKIQIALLSLVLVSSTVLSLYLYYSIKFQAYAEEIKDVGEFAGEVI